MTATMTQPPVAAVKAHFFIYWKCFFGVVALLAIVSNTLIGLDFSYNYKWIAAALSSVVFVWLAWREINLPLVHRAGIYIDAFILIPTAWLSSAGLESPAAAWSLLPFIPINYLFGGRERLFANFAYLAMVLTLIWLYYSRPELYSTYTPDQQVADWLFNLPLIAFFMMFSLMRFERAYESERRTSKQQAEALLRLSETDPLTGLYNRQKLVSVLEESLADYQRNGTPTAMLFLDVDAFKPYNDHYGHSKGDECLRQLAGELLACLRRTDRDFAFRFGGEEFVVVLQHTDQAEGLQVANRLRERIEASAIPHAASPTASHLTVSIGVAGWHADDQSIDDLLIRADRAQYAAKRAGRNQVQVAA